MIQPVALKYEFFYVPFTQLISHHVVSYAVFRVSDCVIFVAPFQTISGFVSSFYIIYCTSSQEVALAARRFELSPRYISFVSYIWTLSNGLYLILHASQHYETLTNSISSVFHFMTHTLWEEHINCLWKFWLHFLVDNGLCDQRL